MSAPRSPASFGSSISISARPSKRASLLAEIDPTVYLARVEADKAQLLNLRAQLADKQAQHALAQQQFQRQSNLAKASATSQEALQSAEAAMRSAAAQVDALRAQIQQTESTLKGDEANLGYTKIYAPMSGTIVSQTSKQGQTLNANQQAPIIYRIADLSTMTVWTQVSEADVSRLQGRHGRLFHDAGPGGPALVRDAAAGHADARGREQRRALQRAVRRAEPKERTDDADDGAGVLRLRRREGRAGGADGGAAPGAPRRTARAGARAASSRASSPPTAPSRSAR